VGGDQLHIGGERAAAFRELVDDLDPRRVLLVGIDVAKASWFVLGCDLYGNVVIDGTKVAADRAGLGQLAGLLGQARARVGAQLVVVGVEAAGHYHQTLAAHLADRDDLLLRLINPAAVAAVRKTQLNRRRKTDWLDAAAICDLLVRGEGSRFLLGDDPRPRCGRCGAAARTSWTPGPASGCRSSLPASMS
jgi:hypothetical protein